MPPERLVGWRKLRFAPLDSLDGVHICQTHAVDGAARVWSSLEASFSGAQ